MAMVKCDCGSGSFNVLAVKNFGEYNVKSLKCIECKSIIIGKFQPKKVGDNDTSNEQKLLGVNKG